MITKNKVVSFLYTLKDKEGQVLDASSEEPLVYLHGYQNIIPGLETELDGLKSGDKKQVIVSPDKGYGDYNDDLKFALPLEQFGEPKPEAGMMVQLGLPEGQMVARVMGVQGDAVMMDANHPLAGETLYFDVEIVEVRDASQEEVTHGHVHGAGGHHH